MDTERITRSSSARDRITIGAEDDSRLAGLTTRQKIIAKLFRDGCWAWDWPRNTFRIRRGDGDNEKWIANCNRETIRALRKSELIKIIPASDDPTSSASKFVFAAPGEVAEERRKRIEANQRTHDEYRKTQIAEADKALDAIAEAESVGNREKSRQIILKFRRS